MTTHTINRVTIYEGDCLQSLRAMPGESVHCVVTDPPYGLSFMGKKWDYDVPSVEVWQECLRVLKPGGHLLAFAGTRTQHRMAARIEDAGFEIRDMIAWVYGSGFSKGFNLKRAGTCKCGGQQAGEPAGVQQSPGALDEGALCGRGQCERCGKLKAEFDGWSSNLKPALEPITVARKPLCGTVAENVLQHGTGALNVDGCRIEGKIGVSYRTPGNGEVGAGGIYEGGYRGEWNNANPHPESVRHNAAGRWPANLIHDGSDEVVGLFPETAPAKQVIGPRAGKESGRLGVFIGQEQAVMGHDDSGGSAARFFYCAKADASERRNSKHPTVKPLALMRYLCRLVCPPDGIVLDPFCGSGTTLEAARLEGFGAIGCELNPEYIADCKERLKQGVLF